MNYASTGQEAYLRILIVTDAWEPQVNGVVRTLKTTARELTRMNHDVRFLTPLDFRTLPCPTYPEIRLSLFPQGGVERQIREFDPDVLHIATEGPMLYLADRRPIDLRNHEGMTDLVADLLRWLSAGRSPEGASLR